MMQFIAIIKDILAIGRLIESLVAMYEASKLRKVEKHIKEKETAKRALSKKIEAEAKKESPDEEAIKDLHRRITRISGKL
jgi:hypothetical protein